MDMRYLTEEHWESFRKGDNNTGTKFEDLVASLLSSYLFPGTWEATGSGSDGAKDFVRQSVTEKEWAECKIFGRSLSLRTLAPTLVMAQIEEVNKIYFFSYSRVTNNSLKYLARFSEDVGKKICVFDDDGLEGLILSAQPIMKEFFPKFKPDNIELKNMVWAASSVRKDPDVDYDELDDEPYRLNTVIISKDENVKRYITGEEEKKLMQVDLGAQLCIDVTLHYTGTTNPIDVQMGLELNDGGIIPVNKEFENGGSINLTLEPGRTQNYRVFLRAVSPSKDTKPPSVTIKTPHGSSIIDSERVDVRFLIRAPLIGKSQHVIMSKSRTLLSKRRFNVFLHLYGDSGTGKTRLLEEIKGELLAHGHRVLSFIGEHRNTLTFTDFMQSLLSRLYKSPRVIAPTNESPAVKLDDFVLSVLYDEELIIEEYVDKCVDALCAYKNKAPTTIIIDNVQAFDLTTICFLNKVIGKLINNSGQYAFVFCFNTSLTIPGTEHYALHERLVGLSSDGGDRVDSCRLNELDDDDAYQLISECLFPSKSNAVDGVFFSTVVKTLANKITKRPLFIIQLLYFLLEKGVINNENARLEVPNVDLFHKSITRLPESLDNLLKLRWKFVLEHTDGRNDIERLVGLLSRLGSISRVSLSKFNIRNSTKDKLITIGILKDSGETIEFFHNEIFLYFMRSIDVTDNQINQQAKFFIESLPNRLEFFPQYFLILYYMNAIDESILIKGARLLLERRLFGAFFIKYLHAYLQNLNSSSINDKSQLVSSAMQACEDVKRYQTHSDGLIAYDATYNWIRDVDTCNDFEVSSALCQFHIEYANARFACGRHIEATVPLEQALRDMNCYDFHTDDERNQYKAHLLDRLAVVYRFQSRYSESEKAMMEAYKLSKDISSIEVKLICTLGVGNLLRLFPDRKNEVIQYWGEAIDIARVNDGSWSSPHIVGLIALIEVQKLILEEKYDDASIVLSKGITATKDNFDHYNQVRLYFCKSLILLLRGLGPQPENNELAGLDVASSISLTYHVDTLYWQCKHFEAVLHEYAEDTYNAEQCYADALKRLDNVGLLKNESLSDRRVELLIKDAVNFCETNSVQCEHKYIDSDIFHYLSMINPEGGRRSIYQSGARDLPYP